MKVAVTGATGFVGRYVIRELAARKIKTRAVTRRHSSGDCQKLDGVEWVECDIKDPPKSFYSKIGNPDVLIHLAWDGLPNYKSLHHFEKELPAQYQFLSELLRDGLPKLFVTGTCFEYGMQSGPLSAKMMTNPNNPYGFAKDALRKQLEYLRNLHQFDLTWARLFYLYGEGQRGDSLFSKLEKSVNSKEESFKMSSGEQLRDYLHIKIAASRIVDLVLGGCDAGVINVCSGNPISIRRFVEKLLEEKHWDIKLELGQLPYPDYEPMAFWGGVY